MASRTALVIGLGLLAAAASASCVVSPQPSPPEAVLKGSLIGLRPGVELAATVVGFEAGPGAVDPPEGVVIVTNLDGADAPSVAAVQPDGSFAIAVPGQPGQSFRFQAKIGGTRSQPIDLEVSASGITASALDTGASCLTVQPGAWLAFTGDGDQRSVVIDNQCAGTVTLAAPHLRRGLAGFSLSSVPTTGVPQGSSVTIAVQAGAGSEAEDVLILDVTAPFTERHAVTLTRSDR
jgi:hypothetical protein